MKRGRSGSAPLSPSRERVPPTGAGEGPSSSRRVPPPGSPHSPPSPAEGEGFVLLGEFGRAHGLKGEVRLKSYTADPAAIASYGPLQASTGRALTLRSVRPAPGGAPDLLIAVVEGVSSREAAEALNRVQLHIAREKLPPAEDEDEFLLADLIGLTVERPDGTAVGRIVAVPNFGGGDLLDIAPAGGGPTALLPFTKAFVPVVDIAGRRVVANPPDDLFDPGRPEPEDAA